MTLGRPPKGPELVDELEGSDQAKRKLRIILETISDEKTIPQACAELGIQRSRFHAMRKMFLLDAVNSLEPRNRGRPPAPAHVTSEQAHIHLLEKRVEALSFEVRAAQIREELAVVMPHVLKPSPAPGTGGSKGKGKSKGSKKKKARTSPEPTEPTSKPQS